MSGMALGPSGKWIAAIRPEGSVCEAARVSLEARLATVVHYLPLAAYHAELDIEHVHRLRVATRRAMAALELYREFLPPKQARWVKKRLKKARRAAGDARDLDVLAERMHHEHGERATAILEKIALERAAVQPQIVRVGERFRRNDKFVRTSAKLIDNIRCTISRDSTSATECFRDWARRQLTTQVQAFLAATPDDRGDLAALHTFRVRGKELRYSIELLAAALPADVRETHYRTVEKLQEHLGRINDHATARDQLRQWASEADGAELKEQLCTIAAEQDARLTAELARWREWWTPKRVEQLREGLSRHEPFPSVVVDERL